MLVDLPRALSESLERLCHGYSPKELSLAAADLSTRYRGEIATVGPMVTSAMDVAAYAATRFPATYAAIAAALHAVAEQRPDWKPQSLLDLGAGMGAGLWAATRVWPTLEQFTAIDAEPRMIEAGRDLCRTARITSLRSARWTQADLSRIEQFEPHDLVLISYVLGELDPEDIAPLLERAWRAATVLVIVEPGTPIGYNHVREAGETLRALGGHSIAPCPHEPPCEGPEGDWIHFSVRLPRNRVHRIAKGAELNYEDEKFSYLAMAREPVTDTYARIMRHPQIRKGHIYLQLCTPDGVKTVVVSKRERERFNRARKAEWGDVFDLPQS
ncbi:MAG: small ribosomal subunit Rsm22 family protein [Nitrolancea sp.]